MNEVEIQRSRRYQEYLIESLKNPERAAGYIAVMLELDEEGYDSDILRSALAEVVEARKQLGDFSEVGQQCFQKLDNMLAETGGKEILALIEFLDALGYRIGIVGKE
ncbi:transcriptional regulator [Calothrix sp. UHCC 0171]|uniref:transcriptional regulator n=1 Tax=Calothrix sp. UHCC 0171 TaxID=3110245 RepID=UPI002B1EC24C|nr:transcriptional regulator [Calothrix sp. UHCC 0171]MEA5572710.1 transcriptional regulator [Calothrix sp. UHCC 0171]